MKTTILFLVMAANCFGQITMNDYTRDLNMFWSYKFSQKELFFNIPDVYYYSSSKPIKTPCGIVSEENASYCPADNNVYVSTDLMRRFFKMGLNISFFYGLMAHEYGHAVQKQLGIRNDYSLESELQADCLGGVYFNHSLSEGKVNLNDALTLHYFYKDVADKFLTKNDIYKKGTHGNFQLRINAFKDGFEKGSVNSCISSFTLIKPSN